MIVLTGNASAKAPLQASGTQVPMYLDTRSLQCCVGSWLPDIASNASLTGPQESSTSDSFSVAGASSGPSKGLLKRIVPDNLEFEDTLCRVLCLAAWLNNMLCFCVCVNSRSIPPICAKHCENHMFNLFLQ